jgi:hypothetical protein
MTQEAQVKELKQSKEELQATCDEQSVKIKLVEGQLLTQHEVQGELRSERDNADRSNRELRERITARDADNLREIKRREKTQRELHDARLRYDEQIKKDRELNETLDGERGKVDELKRKLIDAKATMDKYVILSFCFTFNFVLHCIALHFASWCIVPFFALRCIAFRILFFFALHSALCFALHSASYCIPHRIAFRFALHTALNYFTVHSIAFHFALNCILHTTRIALLFAISNLQCLISNVKFLINSYL